MQRPEPGERKPADKPRPNVMKSAMVTDFVKAFRIKLDIGLNTQALNEELLEFEAAMENLLKEACDVLYTAYVIDKCPAPKGTKKVDLDTIGQINRVLEITDRVFGKALFDEAFARVHASNMSKLGPNGEVYYKDNGCIAKGPHYVPPVIHDLVT